MFLGKVHHHLACVGNLALTRLCKQVVGLDIVIGAHALGYHLEVELLASHLYGIAQDAAGKVERDFLREDSGMGQQRHHDTLKLAYASGNVLGDKVENLGTDAQAVGIGLAAKHLFAQLKVGALKLYGHTPLEACEHSLGHTFKLRRATVARQYDALIIKVQMVEDVEECHLGLLLVDEILYIVDNEDIDALVEVDEFVDLAVAACYRELALKQAGVDIQHAGLRITLLDADAYSMYKVGLAHARGTEHEQRVESRACGIVGDSLAYRASKAVAYTAAVVLKRIVRVELRVEHDVDRSLERIGLYRLVLDGLAAVVAAHIDTCSRLILHLLILVIKIDTFSIYALQYRAYYTYVFLLEILYKVRARYRQGEITVDIADSRYRLEPGSVLVGRQDVLEYRKAIVPIICT